MNRGFKRYYSDLEDEADETVRKNIRNRIKELASNVGGR